jgi:hypothetical protein
MNQAPVLPKIYFLMCCQVCVLSNTISTYLIISNAAGRAAGVLQLNRVTVLPKVSFLMLCQTKVRSLVGFSTV